MQSRNRIENGMVSVGFSVVVNLNGRVESAKPINGPSRFYQEATDIEMRRLFEPIRDKDGTIVRARFDDYVSVDPPEKWLENPPSFPDPVDLNTFSITLERTNCYGSCPAYTVTIDGKGNVTYVGGLAALIPGTHHAVISHEAVTDLVNQIRAAHFLAAQDKYLAGWTDNPTYTLTLNINGIHKQVVDYIGPIVGMPIAVHNLEATIDRVANTDRWLKGSGSMLADLQAEHWDFASASPDNLKLYDLALARQDHAALHAFTAAHTPLFSADASTLSPICVATASADASLMRSMLDALPKSTVIPQTVLDSCLKSAARTDIARVDEWLKRGARVNPPRDPHHVVGDQYDSALIIAIRWGSPSVVERLLKAHASLDPAANRNQDPLTVLLYSGAYGAGTAIRATEYKRAELAMLLHAGANPNGSPHTNQTPLEAAEYEPELIPVLVAAGADVNARSNGDRTALMSTTNIPTLKALLAAGADPTLRNHQNKTAAENFRSEGLKEQADLLDAATNAKLGIATTR